MKSNSILSFFVALISFSCASHCLEPETLGSSEILSYTEDSSSEAVDAPEVYTIPYFQAGSLGGPGFGLSVRLKNNKHALELDGNVSTMLLMSSAEISSSYLYYPKNQSNTDKSRGFSAGMGLAYGGRMSFSGDYTYLTPVFQLGYEGDVGFIAATAHVMKGLDPRVTIYPTLKFSFKY